MKYFKKITISLFLIFNLLATNIYAGSPMEGQNIFLDSFFNLFPKPFYGGDSKYPWGYPKELYSFEESMLAYLESYIYKDLYYRNIDSVRDGEIDFKKELDYIGGHSPVLENNKEFISNYYNKNYLSLLIKNNKLLIEGVNLGAQSWSVYFYDSDGNKLDPSFLSKMPLKNNWFNKSLDLAKMEGIKSLVVSLNTHKLNSYKPSEYRLDLVKSKDGLSFQTPRAYHSNRKFFLEGYRLNPEDFLSLDHLSEKERKLLRKEALSITANLDSDYEKLLALHRWVSSNIYYDFDSIEYDRRGPNDAFSTYMDKKAVCQGYAELTLALARSVNIPTRLVYGYALGVEDGDDSWNDDNMGKLSNHAWNEAFVNGRWIILDTTWDSSNAYKEGSFKKETNRLRYFDPSLVFFSQTHRVTEIIDI